MNLDDPRLVAFLAYRLFGNSVAEWLTALGIAFATYVVGRAMYWFTNRVLKRLAARTQSKLDDILIDMGEEPVVLAITLIGTRIGLETLHLSESATRWVEDGYHVLTALNVGWALSRILDAVDVHYLRPYVEGTPTPVDNTLLPVVRSVVKFGIWICALLVGINNAGYDIIAVLGGLGIGGLAFALAAQDTVANAFGGITVLTLRPFAVGDRIQFNDQDGWVSRISVRNTILKTWKGDEVTVPNKIFTDTAVANLSKRECYWEEIVLHLRHDTTPAQIRKFFQAFDDYCRHHPRVYDVAYPSLDGIERDNFKVTLVYGVESLLPSDQWPDNYRKEMALRTEVNLRILEMLSEQGLFIALPLNPKIDLPPLTGAPFAYQAVPVSAANAAAFEAMRAQVPDASGEGGVAARIDTVDRGEAERPEEAQQDAEPELG